MLQHYSQVCLEDRDYISAIIKKRATTVILMNVC